MKNFILLHKTILLLLTITIFSFVSKEQSAVQISIESSTISLNNTLTIVYLTGTTEAQKQAIRSCLASNFNTSIINSSQCPNNSDAEVLTFLNTHFEDTGTFGQNEDNGVGGKGNLFNYISYNEVNQAIGVCGQYNVVFYSIEEDCDGLPAFFGGNGN